jgi:hypothetical protein
MPLQYLNYHIKFKEVNKKMSEIANNTTEQKETAQEFAARKRQEKIQKLDMHRRDATVVVSETYETKTLVKTVEKIDRAIKQMRLSFGRPNGPTQEQLLAAITYFNEQQAKMNAFANRILKGNYTIPGDNEVKIESGDASLDTQKDNEKEAAENATTLGGKKKTA